MPFKDADRRREYARNYYHRVERTDPDKMTKRMRANTDTHARLLAWYREVKAGLECERCGCDDPVVLEFHHRDDVVKVAEVATLVQRGASRARILAEIAKCIVLCANCHRREHFGSLYQ